MSFKFPSSPLRARAALSGALLWLLAGVVGCNSSNNGDKDASPVHPGGGSAIIGAGSTFIYPIMGRWIADFHQSHSNVQINYQSIGSGGGIEQMKKGLIDFGASDAALDDEKPKEMTTPLIQIPESAGPVCITYNLPELKSPLKLSAETLAGIFLGTIKSWQDPAIKKDNSGVALPNHPILVAHRSDGSGTTNIFTTYLAKVSPEWAKVGKGISVSWPVGVGGKGSEGVTGVIRQSAGAIGYVELSYAKNNNLPVALIRNRAGNFEEPSPAATTAAIEAFHDDLAKDVRTAIVEPPATAKDAYPICGLTYLLVAKDGQDAAKQQTVKDFIQYVITDGQNSAEGMFYAKLSPALVDQDKKLLSEMTAKGQPLSAGNSSANLSSR